MIRFLLLPILLLASLFLFATGNDSIKVKRNLEEMDLVMVDLDNLKASTAINMVNMENEKEIVYSEELMIFETGQLPVDQDLYMYHTSKLEFIIPMEYNEYIKKQIDYFGTNWQVTLKRMATRSQVYFPIYEKILDKNDMPLELKYLSIIESALNPMARSRSGAMGPWQFMPATGNMFHLDVNSEVDERRSVEKSTEAACQYLKQMYNQFGDWYVAIASYNCGPGNIRKAMRLSGSNTFWGMYDYLPQETQNYVPKFIAMAYMMNFYDEFGITPAPMDIRSMQYESVHCTEGMKFGVIAEKLGLTSDELLLLNPELKIANIPYKNAAYTLNVPQHSVETFYANYNEIKMVSDTIKTVAPQVLTEVNATKQVVYTVRKGDCLPIIAKKYDCSITEIKNWNNLKSNTIFPNQKLKINKI